MSDHQHPSLIQRLERLNAIGVALSSERHHQRLLEMILLGAQEITNADGGTLYIMHESRQLKFEMLRNNTLNLALGGTAAQEVPFQPLPLYLDDGSPNLKTVASYAALTKSTVNITDAYQVENFDFSGTRAFDEKTGYHSQSFLTVPMTNHESEVIGVLQLINAMDDDGRVVAFSADNQRLVESLASQAAVAMTNQSLIKDFKNLFEAFIELIADAIDQKSPYTGGHCRRVPELTMMLAQAAIEDKTGPFKDFALDENELFELKVASWLHDCGKITTPESVMDKPTKLSAIFDRIELIDQRFEILKLQAENAMLKSQLALQKQSPAPSNLESALQEMQAELHAFNQQCDLDRDFLRTSNIGVESMTEADQARVHEIGNRTILAADGQPVSFLTENELYNLSIARGTLTAEERWVINNHINVTITMLESLPYPRSLSRVPEYACGHHERMDGKGYPRGLKREEMSVPARIMGIADIFEALTSKDRPYKKAKTLTESLEILGRMKVNHHIDPDLFDVFIREKIYLKYAEKFLEPEQIDDVDHARIPGYTP